MPFVTYERRGRVGVITLDRPDRMNALSPELSVDLRAAQQQLMSDNDVQAGVYTGAGDRAFCAGLDMKAAVSTGGTPQPGGGGPAVGLEVLHPRRIHAARVPLVLVVHLLHEPLVGAEVGTLQMAGDVGLAAWGLRHGLFRLFRCVRGVRSSRQG